MLYSILLEKHHQFKMDRLGEGYAESQELGRQCVAGAKLYSKVALGVTLGSFGGNAINGRLNTKNTFDTKIRNKTIYNGTNKPPTGSVVFFKADESNGNNGHVGISDLRIKKGICILEQNGGGKGNYAAGDEFTLRNRSLKNCLGWYSIKLEDNL